jgi:peptidoglycan/LPS O-acetylase OafA/YrhL
MLAWLLSESRAHVRTLAASPVFRGAVILALAVGAGYFASHNEAWQWPRSSRWLESVGFNAHYFLGQATSLVAMTAVVGCFALATVEFRLLALFGTYSYEIYLLHWALMARYDVFFTRLPEWAAMLCWLVTLVGAGWLLQKASAPLAALLDRQ